VRRKLWGWAVAAAIFLLAAASAGYLSGVFRLPERPAPKAAGLQLHATDRNGLLEIRWMGTCPPCVRLERDSRDQRGASHARPPDECGVPARRLAQLRTAFGGRKSPHLVDSAEWVGATTGMGVCRRTWALATPRRPRRRLSRFPHRRRRPKRRAARQLTVRRLGSCGRGGATCDHKAVAPRGAAAPELAGTCQHSSARASRDSTPNSRASLRDRCGEA